MAQADPTVEGNRFLDDQRKVLLRLIGRISIYYLVMIAGGAVLFRMFPELLSVMPVGGIVDYYSDPFTGIDKSVAASEAHLGGLPWLTDAASLALAMMMTLGAMIPVAWLYKAIHEGHEFDHSIDETALVLPAVVAGVVTVAQQSLALAFSLAGIVAAVRFRRALSDTFDTLFIFVAIGVGLAAGVGAIEIAIVITVFFNYATAIICIFGDGLESKYIVERKRQRLQKKNAKRKNNLKKKTYKVSERADADAANNEKSDDSATTAPAKDAL